MWLTLCQWLFGAVVVCGILWTAGTPQKLARDWRAWRKGTRDK